MGKLHHFGKSKKLFFQEKQIYLLFVAFFQKIIVQIDFILIVLEKSIFFLKKRGEKSILSAQKVLKQEYFIFQYCPKSSFLIIYIKFFITII